MKLSRLFIVILLILYSQLSFSQQFGAFPPSVKWQQIDTDTVRVIYQAAVDSQAQRIAAIIHRMVKEHPNALGNKVRKINTVLHSNTTLANGFVTLAPFRSEYYLIPSSDIFEFGANPWQEELAVHEYRHVHQLSNFNNGITKFVTALLGEEGQALMNVLAVPDWFFEGDAVHAESALTPQGRGRIPYFFNGFHALWREQKDYSWMKLRNGSLKDFIPSYYNLGYLLVNYGYLKYGGDFWRKVTYDATSFKGFLYPFQKAVKRHSGVDFTTFRTDALKFYSHEVSKKRTDKTERKTVTDFHFPQYISADSLLYLKNSYKNIPAFYIRDKKGEHKLQLRNISTENWFSYRNGTIAYTAYDVNPRWTLIDYSNIYLYDIRNKNEVRITSKSKYFTPDFSPSGQQIIAVAVNDSAESALHLLSRNGALKSSFAADNNTFYLHPRFIDEKTIVVVERLPDSRMALSRIDMSIRKKDFLIAPTSALIGYPFVHKDKVYFTSSVGGNDNIYSLNLDDKKIHRLVSSFRGNYYPSVFNDSLTWSKFTSNGLDLQDKAATTTGGKEVGANEWKEVVLPYPVAGDDSLPNILNTPPQQFPVSKYRQSAHLINFHSWRPEYIDPEFTLSLFSDNVLSTFSNEIFYRYNQNESSHGFGLNTSYGGFFPVLNAGITSTLNRTIRTPNRTFTFNTVEARTGYYIPLNFTEGKTFKFLNFGTNLIFNRTTPTGLFRDSLRTTSSTYLSHFVNLSQQLPRAIQHINPKLGYSIGAGYRDLLNRSGYQFLGITNVFLPSIGNHSIVLSASWQETDTGNVVLSNRFANSRGYDEYYFSRMWRASANYHMPLLYPDWGFANLIFFLRVRSNFFFDYTKVYSKNKINNWDLRSVGTEVFFDTKVWNALPVSFGFRVSHLLDRDFSNRPAGRNVFEFVLPVSLIPERY
ncbi:MAG TPA: hypothetical protein VM368_02870 [Flavisolibacter sp.]|nr:hypothetical protein [Flavisolibacter sp.]